MAFCSAPGMGETQGRHREMKRDIGEMWGDVREIQGEMWGDMAGCNAP